VTLTPESHFKSYEFLSRLEPMPGQNRPVLQPKRGPIFKLGVSYTRLCLKVKDNYRRALDSIFVLKGLPLTRIGTAIDWMQHNQINLYSKTLYDYRAHASTTYELPLLGAWELDKGPSIKDVRTKSRKIDLLARKMSVLAQPLLCSPLSVRTHKKFRKILSFLHQ